MAKKPLEKKQCFVVGPIGDDDSDDRIHADWLLEDIIEPVFKEHFPDFDVTRADKISNPGQITSQVITALLEAELVIADLTTLNPNAFYEIGIRHTIQKPIIHVHLEGQRIPFDIAPFRSIKFSRRRPSDIRAARASLLASVSEATNPDHEIDNPVTFSRGKLEFEQTATPVERVMQDQIAELSRRLGAVEDRKSRDIKPSNALDILTASFGRVIDGPGALSLHVKSAKADQKAIIRDAEMSLSRFFPSFSTVPLSRNDAAFSVHYTDENLLSMEYVREELVGKGYDVRVAVPKDRRP